jgi:hypothetical protein
MGTKFIFLIGLFSSLFSSWGMAQSVTTTSNTTPRSTDVAEIWKGPSPKEVFTVGGVTGVGIVDGFAGFTLLGQGAIRILSRGFIGGEINDQVFAEVQFGPVFAGGTTFWLYGAHLRWDFNRDEDVTFFATAGLGGTIAGRTMLNQVEFYPHLGLGLFWHFANNISLRAEISHAIMGLGVSFGF